MLLRNLLWHGLENDLVVVHLLSEVSDDGRSVQLVVLVDVIQELHLVHRLQEELTILLDGLGLSLETLVEEPIFHQADLHHEAGERMSGETRDSTGRALRGAGTSESGRTAAPISNTTSATRLRGHPPSLGVEEPLSKLPLDLLLKEHTLHFLKLSCIKRLL